MTSTEAPTALTELNQRWADAFNARDLPRLMEFYEPDAVVVPGPGADPVRGLPAVEEAMRAFLALGGTVRFTPRYLIVRDDTALGSISFVVDGARDPDGNPVDLRGTTSEVVRRQADGTWKYVVDHPFGGSDDAQ